jgi:hypothetical protein
VREGQPTGLLDIAHHVGLTWCRWGSCSGSGAIWSRTHLDPAAAVPAKRRPPRSFPKPPNGDEDIASPKPCP